MNIFHILILIFHFNFILGCGNKCLNSPPIPNSYPGCVCPLKNYPYTFPAGSSAVDLIYQTNGQNIAANVIQNGIVINSCPLTKSCTKRNIHLNEYFPYTITLFRSTDKNKNGAWLNSFQINPRDTQENGEIFLNPPELNVGTENQDGYIDAGVTYNYTLPVDDSVWIDMEFDENINITVAVSQNDSLITVYSNSYIYEQVNLSSLFDTYTVTVFSKLNSHIKRMNIESNSNDDNVDDESTYVDKPMLIGILTLTIITFIIVMILAIVSVNLYFKKFKKVTYLNMT